jgi:hypothetical protein
MSGLQQAGISMTTLSRAMGGQVMGGTRAGLVLAWTFTVTAILAIGLVAVTAPLPQPNAASTATAGSPSGAAAPVQKQHDAATGGLGV